MPDPIGAAEVVEVRTFGRWTDFRLPTALLWMAVSGGMLMLYLSGRLAAEQLRDHEKRISAAELAQARHAAAPSHARTARYMLELEDRVKELEAEEDTE